MDSSKSALAKPLKDAPVSASISSFFSPGLVMRPKSPTKTEVVLRCEQYLLCVAALAALGALCVGGGNSFSTLLKYLFSFCLGGACTLIVALVIFMLAVEKEQQKVLQEKRDAIKDAQISRQLLQSRKIFPGETPRDGKEKGWKQAESKEDDLQGWAKLFPSNPHSTSSELESKELSFIILKSNLLFEFREEKDTECLGVMCLDRSRVTIEITRKNAVRGERWQKKNSIKIEKLPENKSLTVNGALETVYIYFNSAKQLQTWYLSICKAAKLASKTMEEIADERLEKQHFGKLKDHLLGMANGVSDSSVSISGISGGLTLKEKIAESDSDLHKIKKIPSLVNPGSSSLVIVKQLPVSATWFNAVISRIFWNFHNTTQLTALIRNKIAAKIGLINPPSIVENIEIGELVLGPNLPLLDNIQLVSLDAHGEVRVDADVKYFGGAHLTIKILITVNFVSISVPLTISATLKSLFGRLQFYVGPPPSDVFWIGFHSEPTVELEVHTEIGRHSKIVDFPTLAKIVIEKLKSKLIKTMVLPNMDDYNFFNTDDIPAVEPLPAFNRTNHAPQPTQPTQSTSSKPATTTSSSFSSLPSISGLTSIAQEELIGLNRNVPGGSSSLACLPSVEDISIPELTNSGDGNKRIRSRSLTQVNEDSNPLEEKQAAPVPIPGTSSLPSSEPYLRNYYQPKPLPMRHPAHDMNELAFELGLSPSKERTTGTRSASSSPHDETPSYLSTLWRNFTKN